MNPCSEVEIFVRGCRLNQVIDWLKLTVGPLQVTDENNSSTRIASSLGNCVIKPGYRHGPFTRVMLELNPGPWSDSFECAKQAAEDLGCVVRCLKGKHMPEYCMTDGTPMYVEFDGNSPLPYEPAGVLLWRTGPDVSLLERFLNFRSSLVLLMNNLELAGSGFGHDDFEAVVESIFDATFASYIRDEYGLPMYGSSYQNFIDGHGIVLKCSDNAHCINESTKMFPHNYNEATGASVSSIMFHCFMNPNVESDSRLNLDFAAGFQVLEPKDLSVSVENNTSSRLVFIPIESVVDCEIWTTNFMF